MKKLCLILPVFLSASILFGQTSGVAISADNSLPHPSAILDVKSNIKGLLAPRMSRADRLGIISPATGLLIYQDGPDTTGFYYYNGNLWLLILGAINGDEFAWKTNGNIGLNPTSTFIGTKDAVPLNIRVYNEQSGYIDYNTSLGNTFWGYQSGKSNAGTFNTGIGSRTLMVNVTGLRNTAVGNDALFNNSSGNDNVALGYFSLLTNQNGTRNTAVGSGTLLNNLGNLNSAFGYHALFFNRLGTNNTAVGVETLNMNDSGSANSAFGHSALHNNTGGESNTSIGVNALYDNRLANANTALGAMAGITHQSGDSNVIIGYRTLNDNISGAFNTAIGTLAGKSNIAGNGNIFIGYEAGYNETGSNKLYIANSNTMTPLIGGDFTAKTVNINDVLVLKPTTAPTNPVKGMLYFDSITNKYRAYDGTTWHDLW